VLENADAMAESSAAVRRSIARRPTVSDDQAGHLQDTSTANKPPASARLVEDWFGKLKCLVPTK
jgi:hypothetical protein